MLTTETIMLNGQALTVDNVADIAQGAMPVAISQETYLKIGESRQRFENIVAQNIPIYGVTTGYGEMVHIFIEIDRESELQTNLVRSHCAGVGPVFTEIESRAMLAARINALARGYSAVRPQLIERMVCYLNRDIIPVIPQIGSLGASGDLAPLSHIAITLIGEGYVWQRGEKMPTAKVLADHGIDPLQLKFKEGLALINGTSAMTGLGSLIIHDGLQQTKQAEIISCLVLETQKASNSPFLSEGHEARPHQGQIDVAHNIRTLTHNSRMMVDHENLCAQVLAEKLEDETLHSTNTYIQKAYTLRCIPQIIGAVRDSLYHAQKTLEIELNSSNDNPLFFEEQLIFHGGNFHGQPIAIILDLAAIALTQIGIVSERRTNRLLNRYLSNGLPEFLVKNDPGLNCGFAGAQYPATALIAENRTICSPASIQSVPSNGDNQDVVSMGLIAARNAKRILENNQYILAVEYMSAAQAVDILGCYEDLSLAGKIAYDTIRKAIPVLEADRFMSDDIERVAALLAQKELLTAIEDAGFKLV